MNWWKKDGKIEVAMWRALNAEPAVAAVVNDTTTNIH